MKIPFKKKSKDYEVHVSALATACKDIQKKADDFLKDFKNNYDRLFSESITSREVYTESYVKSKLKELSKIARKTKDEIKSYADLVAKSGKAIDKGNKTFGACMNNVRWNRGENGHAKEYTKCVKLYKAIVEDYGKMCQILSNKPVGETHFFWHAAEIIGDIVRENINGGCVKIFWQLCPWLCDKEEIEKKMVAIPADS